MLNIIGRPIQNFPCRYRVAARFTGRWDLEHVGQEVSDPIRAIAFVPDASELNCLGDRENQREKNQQAHKRYAKPVTPDDCPAVCSAGRMRRDRLIAQIPADVSGQFQWRGVAACPILFQSLERDGIRIALQQDRSALAGPHSDFLRLMQNRRFVCAAWCSE